MAARIVYLCPLNKPIMLFITVVFVQCCVRTCIFLSFLYTAAFLVPLAASVCSCLRTSTILPSTIRCTNLEFRHLPPDGEKHTGIYLSLSHIGALLVYEQSMCCHLLSGIPSCGSYRSC